MITWNRSLNKRVVGIAGSDNVSKYQREINMRAIRKYRPINIWQTSYRSGVNNLGDSHVLSRNAHSHSHYFCALELEHHHFKACILQLLSCDAAGQTVDIINSCWPFSVRSRSRRAMRIRKFSDIFYNYVAQSTKELLHCRADLQHPKVCFNLGDFPLLFSWRIGPSKST